MPLNKSFLSKKIHINKFNSLHLWGGIVVWLLLSFSFYTFTILIIEIWRLPIWNSAGEEIVILSGEERNFFSFFFACLSCIVSWGIVVSLLFKASLQSTRYLRYKRFVILSQQNTLSWYFLSWFSKLAISFGLFYTSISLYKHFNLFYDYKFIFIGSLIILFLHQWMEIRLVFKRNSLKWMLFAACLIVSISFIFSRIRIIDYERLDQLLMKKFVIYNYTNDLPGVVSSLKK